MFPVSPHPHPDLAPALRECRQGVRELALFSGVANLFMLARPAYMLRRNEPQRISL
jgi:ABC-type protease/lipase transport system fused ATPase/permease subunit